MRSDKSPPEDSPLRVGPDINALRDIPTGAREEVIRIAIVDDHPIMRDGLVYTFQREPRFEVVAQGGTGAEAIQIAEMLLPDLILLDINMPGDGVEAARKISRSCPAVRIIMLTAHDGEQHVVDALRGGASGYVVKGVSSDELLKTAQAVYSGEAYVSPGLAAKLLGTRGTHMVPGAFTKTFVDLTTREEQILRFVCEGQSNKEIGENIGLTEKTVKHYMTNILQKLHARNRVEAALIARERLGSYGA
ncbi:MULTISPECIES: response regulator transcription factor [Rhodomicrobium]|uniref:response regulator n=1 Tax=Rhodomicrobium TaxID=1068 RepID=UPI000B4B28D3|nr:MULTISPECIES: response regulator transcription factor [Rhodomicrobium]